MNNKHKNTTALISRMIYGFTIKHENAYLRKHIDIDHTRTQKLYFVAYTRHNILRNDFRRIVSFRDLSDAKT